MRVVTRATAADPDALFGLIPGEGVSVLEVVPSLLRAALDSWDIAGDEVKLPGLRWLVVTGEALPPDLCARWFQRFPDVPLVNAYGPTECSDDVTHAVLRAGGDYSGVRVPIGQPVRNTRLYVLGDELRPVPAGSVGELYVGGLVVGRGYVGDPERTAAVFVADPFGEPGTRMYRTGDRVLSRPDGSLEFVERRDFQVKIRGHRIELGEIESTLNGHPAVTDAVVVVHGKEKSDQQLVAYVVPGEPIEAADLRGHLADLLPAYLVPSAFVLLDRLPLTAHGKVDRKALPAPEAEVDAVTRAPRTPVEEILCGIYADVLGVPSVGIDDDFFALGGHSLLATAVVSRVRSALDTELAVRELFEARTVARLAGRLASAGRARAAFRKLDRPERPPLSFAQLRMWFLNRLEGEQGGYTIPLAVRLSGDFDRAALAAALADLVARHEILRTVFPDADGVPHQRVTDATPALEVTSLPESELATALAAAAARGFDLAVDQPFRCTLFAVGADHVLLLVLHHIAGDAWSVDVLARDLATAYQARLRGRAPDWAELPAQYADYAVWQRELLGDEGDRDSELNRHLAFWREALADLPAELDLPLDRPRTAATAYRGGTVDFDVPPEVHKGLKALAARTGASVFMVAQAALGALLTKLGAGTDIPVGSLVAGRTDEAVHDLVGFFVNTLVLRTDTSGDPRFAELVARVRETDLAAYAHQELPFERLLELIQPARSLSRQPLFGVMLSFYEVPEPGFSLGGLHVRSEPLERTHGKFKFDLTFQLGERRGEGGLEGALEYSADLFTPATAELFAERFARLLEAVAADPDLPLSRIDVLTERERRVIADWRTAAEAPAELPGAGDADLRIRVNRLARALLARGAGPEKIVAIDLPPSPERHVAMLAVLAAGAAYLVLDPDRRAEQLAGTNPVFVLRGDLEAAEFSGAELTGPPPAPDHPAWVSYPTGSTEAVVLTRGALATGIAAARGTFGAGDRLLAPDADYAVPVVLAALGAGAAVVIAGRDEVRDPAALARRVEAERPTALLATPSLAKVLTARHAEALRSLRVRTIGEETAEYRGHPETGYLSLADRPVANIRAYVLDERLRPVPPGGRGELYLAGGGLARGYLGRAARTASRFVADPFGPPGSRMFRTGDLAKWRPDGVLEFAGRAGERTTVRGFAVRPVEVEAALAGCPGVAAAAVVVRDERLVAYLIPEGRVDSAAIRDHLAKTLPDYLVPSAFVELDTFPLTGAGRLDRAALPAPAAPDRAGPSSPAARILRNAFAETLGLAEVDVDASFFDLGGNSLRSVRLVALARKAGLRLTVADVLTHGTVERLAEIAEPGAAEEALVDPFAPVLPIRPAGTGAPLFCVHAGLGLSLPYLGLAAHLGDRPIYGLQSPNVDGTGAFPASVEEVAAEYLGRIREIQPHGPYHLLGWSFGGLLAYEMAVQLQAAGEQVASLSILDSYPVEDETVRTERELLTSFLEHVGFDGAEFAGRELTAADVIEVLRRGDSRLADIGERRMRNVLAVMNNNAVLAHKYRPGRFTGKVLLFVATAGLTKKAVAEQPRRWKPLVDGTVRVRRVDCGHEYLMHPGPQGAIGAVLAAELNRSTNKGEL
ncbi:condensation domain-containing protein [Amycolatopsis anabasis]|uniref:condensation domain-containing protein n=1 Tax=Amycolatopsis anabasis TaxID=1840409 RepID=UPI0024845180|nr:non-ribosomal peptide synthetase [Amycolatopsis anabasis]